MLTRHNAMIDGISINSISPCIIVHDITENDPREKLTTSAIPSRGGTRFISRERESLQVDIDIEIHEYDTLRRKEIMSRVVSWMYSGSWLTISDREGQRLLVRPFKTPALGSASKWTELITLSFVAYELPYWQEINPVAQTATMAEWGVAASVYLSPVGSYPCHVECIVTNVGEYNVTWVQLSSTSTWEYIRLENVGLQPGKSIIVEYDENYIQRIRIDGNSILHKRTGTSSDNLTIECGKPSELKLECDGVCSCLYKARGCWL